MRPLKFAKLWLALGWAYALLIAYLSLTSAPPRVAEFDQADKLKHLAGYALLMGGFLRLYQDPAPRRRHAWIFLGMGLGLELLQGLGGVRSMEAGDALANALGLALAWLLARYWRPLKASPQ